MPSSLPHLCAAALALAAFVPAAARAQDTTRVPPDSARADATRARPDSARVGIDTAQAPVRIPVPPPLPPPWRFQIDVGFQDVAGNRALTVFNGAVTIERRRQDRYILSTKLEGRFGKSNGVEAVNAQALGLRFDWHPRDRVSPFLGTDLTRDRIRLIGLRAQGGTGLNLNADIRDDRRTYFSLGLIFDHREYLAGVSPGTVDDTRWLLRAATTRLIGPATRIEATAKFEPATEDGSDYLASVVASVRVALTRRAGLTTRFEYQRDSRPAPGVVPDDRSLTVALSFAW